MTIPGPQSLIAGDKSAGFYGEVPSSQFITGTALASRMGITMGTAQNDTEPWLKFNLDGKILFIAKKPFRHTISWDHINSVGAVYGNKTVNISGKTYKVRLIKGAAIDPADWNATDKSAIGSEWNRLILPITDLAENQAWRYPAYAGTNVPDWGIRYSYSDIVTRDGGGNGYLTWCQEAITTVGGYRIIRGGGDASNVGSIGSNNGSYTHGWRPVLELVNSSPTNVAIPNQSTQLNTNKTIDLSTYFSDADGDALTYTASSSNTAIGTVSVSGSILTLSAVSMGSTTITVTANDGKGGTTPTSFVLTVVNSAPTVTLTSPSDSQTLYENDILNIAGTARDENANQSVTVYYQINSETRRVLATDLSQKNIALTRQLTFKAGKLHDGATAVTVTLTEGVAHKLKIWAVDDQGAQSTIAERTFYAVPNRAPFLTVNTPSISGNIDTDKIQLSGAYSDPDGNACTVSYKINGGNSVQIASGVSGNWNFEITFGQLVISQNNIIIENIDSYGAKTSKTVKLNKTAIETPLLKSVARYKLTPPLNEATGVLLYVQRSADLVIDVKISMTLTGEPETFVPMSLENTAPVPGEEGIVEDEFYYIADNPKQNIVVQIDMERTSVDVNDKIIVIEGAFY